jgi:hypothetical protein
MPRILLDGTERPFTPAPSSWGDLLRLLDGELGSDGRIVTDVRFDGVDEAAFRERATLERTLDACATVEVITGTPAGLMDRCLEEALAAIAPLAAAAMRVGARFRGVDVRAANEELSELADGLTSVIGIVGAAGLAYQVDLRNMRCGDQVAATVVAELTTYLESLVGAQEAGDWIAVADILQFDVEPALRRLAPVLDSMRIGEPAA